MKVLGHGSLKRKKTQVREVGDHGRFSVFDGRQDVELWAELLLCSCLCLGAQLLELLLPLVRNLGPLLPFLLQLLQQEQQIFIRITYAMR